MPDLGFIDIVIGLIFVYLIIALAVTALNELIAQAVRLRANTLKDGLAQMLGESGAPRGKSKAVLRFLSFRSLFPDGGPLTDAVLAHPTIRQLGNHPSYIPATAIGRALARNPIAGPAAPNVPAPVAALLADAGGNLVQFEQLAAESFDATMNRVSGWYKRRIRSITLVLSVLLVGLLNADTIEVFNHLQTDDASREAIVGRATLLVEGGEDATLPGFEKVSSDLSQSRISFGWIRSDDEVDDPREVPSGTGEWVRKVVGLLMTALAASLGAPFWFDMLGRVANLRASGKPERTGSS